MKFHYFINVKPLTIVKNPTNETNKKIKYMFISRLTFM